MKIWFDLSNSPHINLFFRLIRELKAEGHEVVITCRPLANTVELLDLHQLQYEVVGKHYGAAMVRKLAGYPARVWELVRYLRGRSIDVAVSQSSFHSPVVARILGIRSIYMNDNEHALGNVPSFICANHILLPEHLGASRYRRWWFSASKVRLYPGVKEGIYLWALKNELLAHQSVAPRQKPSVYIRPEPWAAQYYKGARNFIDELLIGIKDHVRVTLLPRGAAQAEHYRDTRFDGIRIPCGSLSLRDIVPDCDLFVGAGGTMTREMAVLGIPTVSIYQDELLDVDRFLLSTGAFRHLPTLSAAQLLDVVAEVRRRAPDTELLAKGQRAYQQIKASILGDVPETAVTCQGGHR